MLDGKDNSQSTPPFALGNSAGTHAPRIVVENCEEERKHFSEEVIIRALQERKLPALDGEIVLTACPSKTTNRKDRDAAWRAFIVKSSGRPVVHLTVSGAPLKDIHEKYRAFAEACPDIACRPLFFVEGGGTPHLFGREYFEGDSLEDALTLGKCNAEEWRRREALFPGALIAPSFLPRSPPGTRN